MRKFRLTVSALAAFANAACACATTTANAAISDLFNTGVGSSGAVLPGGTIGDPHYTLVLAPSGSTTDIRVRTSARGYPIPPYVGDDTLSAWIGPNNDSALRGPVGNYEYHTTFMVGAGDNPATISITGRYSTDNEGVDILLNGHSTGITNKAQYTSWSPFSITRGFVAGTNTLDFIVHNDGGPTALRVEMTGAVATISQLSLGR